MLVLPLVAAPIYTIWVNAFTTATVCAVYEVRDAGSAKSHILSIYRLALMRFSVRIAPSVKWESVLPADLGGI